MAGDKKTSALPIMLPEDLVATDGVIVLDKSATSGDGSGPGGTLKQMDASGLTPFTTTTGVVHNLNLVGIDTNNPLFNWAASAINTYGPYTANRGQDFLFRSYQVSGPSGNNTITITYFKLLSGRLIAGGLGNTISPTELTLSGGPYIINPELNADLFLEIGDVGALAIHTYFNLGKDHIITGDPWVVDGQQFLTGTLAGVPTIWQFLAGDGDWGGTSGNNTTAADFINLSLQPPAVGFPLTKIHPLSLTGIATVNPVTGQPVPELNYIAAAVAAKGPFTCMPGQQMVMKTTTVSGGTGGSSIPTTNVVTRYYRVIPNVNTIGGPLGAAVFPTYFMPDGQGLVRLDDTDDELVAELGDISTGPVEDYFNLGEETSPSVFEPWDMTVKRFVRATLDGDVTLWAFVGEEGFYGATGPLFAGADDFFNITDQPATPSEVNKLFYEDIAAMIADQESQSLQNDLCVKDASDDPNITFGVGETKLQAFYRWTGTTDEDIDDYELMSAPYSENGGGGTGTVESVTGDGVDNTDPDNPVLTFPTPAEIGMTDDDTMASATSTNFPSGESIKAYVDKRTQYMDFACSNETTSLAVGEVFKMVMMRALPVVTKVDFSVTTAPTGSTIILNVKKNGTTIYSTKPTIDASEFSTLTAATAQVLTGATAFATGDILSVEIDQVGSTVPGKGLKAMITYNN